MNYFINDKSCFRFVKKFKIFWNEYNCSIPYMGFNLLPLSVIPEFRLTNKGLINVNKMEIVPLFEK